MRYTIIALTLFLNFCSKPKITNSKNSVESNSKIESIVFYNISIFVNNPNEAPDNISTIIVNDKNIFLCQEVYSNNKLLKVDTIKTLQTNTYERKIFTEIPDEYLKKDSRFGDINMADEGSLGVTVNLINDKQVFIELSYQVSSLPKEMQKLLQLKEEIEDRLYNTQ